MLTKSQKQPCACCSIFFESKICPQCQVAGCASTVGGKKHKCLLQGNMIAVMALSEFQVRAELAELKTKYAELLTESQRVTRILLHAETQIPGLRALDAAGVDPSSQRGKVSMLAGAAR